MYEWRKGLQCHNKHNSVKHERTASSQDSDPVLYLEPLCRDDHFSGSKACTTTCLGHRVTSVLLDEMPLWDFTDRGPSPIVYVGTNVVDEKTHKIINACCHRPPFCSCQRADDSCQRADDCDVNWLDLSEDELLPDNLFETEQCEGARNGFYDQETRETTHEDKRLCPRERYLTCKSVISNIGSSGSLQSSICGTNDDRASGSYKRQTENHDYGQPGCPNNARVNATIGQNDTCPNISMENIRTEQEKDPTLSLLLQWKRAWVKSDWAIASPYCKELKAYWYQWDTLEIKDEILCKKYIRADGSGIITCT